MVFFFGFATLKGHMLGAPQLLGVEASKSFRVYLDQHGTRILIPLSISTSMSLN